MVTFKTFFYNLLHFLTILFTKFDILWQLLTTLTASTKFLKMQFSTTITAVETRLGNFYSYYTNFSYNFWQLLFKFSPTFDKFKKFLTILDILFTIFDNHDNFWQSWQFLATFAAVTILKKIQFLTTGEDRLGKDRPPDKFKLSNGA